ncbi:MAG: hypothetical protein EZS28_004170 [Streblomastix strix]|uniref:Uncharacterized protein n=1 Tax=Streblomastix strix TaxID=222440 RepID=A0A5J4X1E6_9EUKA|nr:MAG: hypothetical protein EZS28_004170 [Streblomastix strix]
MNEIGIWERLIPRPSEGGLCCFPQKIDFGTVPVHSIFYTTIVIAMRRGTNENDHITIVPGSHRLVTLGKV